MYKKNDDKIQPLISTLLELTRNDKIHWKYLDDDEPLEGLVHGVYNEEDMSTEIFSGLCFIAPYKQGFFAVTEIIDVFGGGPRKISLAIIPALDSRSSSTADSPQSDLVRLHNLIKSKFPNVDTFIDEFLDEFKGF